MTFTAAQLYILKWIILGCTLLGIVFLVIGFLICRRISLLTKHCSITVNAKILEIRLGTMYSSVSVSDPDSHSYFPLYSYEFSGQTFTRLSDIGSKKDTFRIGQTITLFINPQSPMEYWSPQEHRERFGQFFGLVGSCCLIAALLLWFIPKL